MARLKEGAFTGYLDINGDSIAVGDTLKDRNGELWRVNSWLQAVPEGEGMAKPLKQLGTAFCKIHDPKAAKPAEEHTVEPVKEPEPEPAEAEATDTLASATDGELAGELRRRGWTVRATKEVLTIVEL